jgi:hypothetical protein
VADAAAAQVDSRQPDAEGTFHAPDGPPMDGRPPDAQSSDAPLPDASLPDAAGPPPSPTGLRACAADSQVTIAFDAVLGATSYDLYVGSAPGVTPQNGIRIAGVTSPYVRTGLTDGQALYAVAVARGSSGASAPSQQVSATPSAAMRDTMVLRSWRSDGIEIYDCVSQLPTHTAQGTRAIVGDQTLLVGDTVRGLALDPAGAEIYFANDDAILVFDDATRVHGNVAPARRIAGAKTLIATNAGLVLDHTRNRLYLGREAISSPARILVWNDASTIDGEAPPDAELTGLPMNGLTDVFLDETNDRLYVADFQLEGIYVYDGASKLTGAVNRAPDRTIVPSVVTEVQTIIVDATRDILYLANRADPGYVDIYAGAATLSASVAPARRFLASPNTIGHVVVNNQLFSFGDSSSELDEWLGAADSLSGNGATARTLTATVASPIGAAAYAP